MGWEVSDNRKFNEWFSKLGGKEKVAILGDCTFYSPKDVSSNRDFARHYSIGTIDSFDVFGKPTHKVDLNLPIPEEFYDSYDWVLDAGTAFCCFNPAQVLFNIHRILKRGGVVFQFASLFGYLNRGYYSFHPILFQEFYRQNGYEIMELCWRQKGQLWETMNDINMFQNERLVHNDSAILVVARKVSEGIPIAPLPDLYS